MLALSFGMGGTDVHEHLLIGVGNVLIGTPQVRNPRNPNVTNCGNCSAGPGAVRENGQGIRLVSPVIRCRKFDPADRSSALLRWLFAIRLASVSSSSD
jgi:hypothetical protein